MTTPRDCRPPERATCETWHVSGEAARTLVETLANPPEPNEALLVAAKRFAALIASHGEHQPREVGDA